MSRIAFTSTLRRIALLVGVSLCIWNVQGATKYSVTIKTAGSEAARAGVTATFPQTKQYEAGKKVSYTLPVKNGTFVSQWTVSPKTGKTTYLTGVGKTVTFVMPACDVTLTAQAVTAAEDADCLTSLNYVLKPHSSSSDANIADEGVVETPSGLFFRAFLQPNAGGVYSKLTLKPEGLPKGLKITPTNMVLSVSGKSFQHTCWLLEGIIEESVDYFTAPCFIKLTSESKASCAQRLPLIVSGPVGTPSIGTSEQTFFVTKPDSAFNGLGTGWVPTKGLPPGLKYTAKDIMFGSTFVAAGSIYGYPTKAGSYDVLCSHKKVVNTKTFTETGSFCIYIEPSTTNLASFPGLSSTTFLSTVGERVFKDFATMLAGAQSPTVTGLPAGLKFTPKYIVINRNNGPSEAYTANSVYGTPTKAGSYVVTIAKKAGTSTVKQQFFWTVLPSATPEATNVALSNGDWTTSQEEMGSSCITTVGRIHESGTDILPLQFDVPTGAKVTASGLPAGLKLVKGDEGVTTTTYGLEGMATKAGPSVATFKITKDGSTSLLRVNIDVGENPIAGTLCGSVLNINTDYGRFPLGTATVTADAAGNCTALINDGLNKATVKIKGYYGNPYFCCVAFKGTIPASKGEPAYDLTLNLASKKTKSGERVIESHGATMSTADSSLYNRELYLIPVFDERCHDIACAEGEDEYTDCWCADSYQFFSFWLPTAARHPVFGGSGGYVTICHAPSKKVVYGTAKIQGRTPDGLAFSGTVYQTYDFEESEHVKSQYSPFVVYNKATGNHWMFRVFRSNYVQVSCYNADYGYVRDVYGDWGGSQTYTRTHGPERLWANFLSAIYDFSQPKGNIACELQTNLYNPSSNTFTTRTQNILAGDGNSPQAKISYSSSTGIAKFSAKIDGITYTYEGVLAPGGQFRGWCSAPLNGKTLQGTFYLKAP